MSISAPDSPYGNLLAAQAAAPAVHAGDPRLLGDVSWLDFDVASLIVKPVGRVEPRAGSGLPLVVLDGNGSEMEWVTRCLVWLRHNGLAEDTVRSYAKSYLRAFRPMWAAGINPKTLDPLQYNVIRGWLRHCMTLLTPASRTQPTGRLAPSTLQQTETALHMLYDTALSLGMVTVNPVEFARGTGDREVSHTMLFDTGFQHHSGRDRGRQIAKVPEKQIVTLSVHQRSSLRNSAHPRDRALFTTMLDSGPRASESLSMTRRHLFLDDSYAEVIGKGLAGQRRVIPLCDESVETIRAYLAWLDTKGMHLGLDDPLWRGQRAPHTPLTYSGLWKAVDRSIPNEHFHPHCLRHTAATEMLELLKGQPGDPLLIVQKILGHAHLSTTQRYLHVSNTQVIAAHLRARRTPVPEADPIFHEEYTPDAIQLLRQIREDQLT